MTPTAILIGLACTLIAFGAPAQEPIDIKFSHVVASDTPKGKAAERFAQRAEEKTNGRVKVTVYANSTLYKDKEELEALQLGAVQMLAPSLAKFGPLGVKEFEVFDLPYLLHEAFRESVWGLLLIFVVMGGIYSGIFTPTEAAAMGAVYAFLVAVCVYRDMPLRRVGRVLLDSANMSAMLLYIITNAVLFSFLLTHESIPQGTAGWLVETGLGQVGFLIVVNVLLLLAGNIRCAPGKCEARGA